MEQYNICVYDSGVGGLDIAIKLNKMLHMQKILYFCDSKNMPYGNKSFFRLKKLIIKNIKNLIEKYHIKIFVIACNTATIVALDILRKKFKDIIFVGTEPAIKPALKNLNKNDKIIVLCTKTTAKHSKIIKKYKTLTMVDVFAVKELASLIEHNILNLNCIFRQIKKLFENIDATQYTKVVLGCTHYPFAKELLKKIFKNAKFYDGAKGVVLQTTKLLKEKKKPKINISKKIIKNKKSVKKIEIEVNNLIFNGNKFQLISSTENYLTNIKKYLNKIVV